MERGCGIYRTGEELEATCRELGTLKQRFERLSLAGHSQAWNTEWLGASGLRLDERGFVLTGADVDESRLPLETSRRGVFAVGDVRACSVKRVAASVGDGAQAVASIHAYFARRQEPAAPVLEQQVVATA